MAIIKCMECGQDISDKATVCPHCGFPIAEKAKEMALNAENARNEYKPENAAPQVTVSENDFEYEFPEKESGLSIACLVCYILSVLGYLFHAAGFASILALASFILLIASHFVVNKKIICATIVFWITTVAFALVMILAFLMALFT